MNMLWLFFPIKYLRKLYAWEDIFQEETENLLSYVEKKQLAAMKKINNNIGGNF